MRGLEKHSEGRSTSPCDFMDSINRREITIRKGAALTFSCIVSCNNEEPLFTLLEFRGNEKNRNTRDIESRYAVVFLVSFFVSQ